MNDWYQFPQENVQQTLTLHPSVCCFVRLHPALLTSCAHSSGGSRRHQIRQHSSNNMSPVSTLAYFTEDAFGVVLCITRESWPILNHTASYATKTYSLEKQCIYFPIFNNSVPHHCSPPVGSYLD